MNRLNNAFYKEHNDYRCMKKYIEAIDAGETCFELSAELGKEVVTAMNEVVRYVKEK